MDRRSRERELALLYEAERRRARESLIAYTQATYPTYRAAWHHREIAAELERIGRTERGRLLIVEPPRHGKSELASRRFPLWWLGNNPGCEVVAASYGSRLVKSFGRTMRNLASSSAHRRIFPGTTLSVDSQAQDLWRTADGGSYQAVGVGSGITGFGADLIVIDDPVQGREQADSEVMQAKVWDWYLNDMYTRRQPGCSIVVIGTRWHEEDLIGKLLQAQGDGGDQWEVLHHPAINEAGEALWPESFPIEELERTRAQMDMSDPRIFRSLYQGDPLPDEGVFFKREWLRYAEAPPRERMRIYAASDYATKHDGGDYTVHVIIGVDPEDNIHVLDLWRARTESDVWVEQCINLADAWGPLIWAEEGGQIIGSVGPFLVRRMRERSVYFRREQFSSPADKPTRARSIQGRWAAGKVYLPLRRIDWVGDLVAELMSFPLGKTDDQVDALSLIGRMLAALVPGKDEEKPPPPLKGIEGMTPEQLYRDHRRRVQRTRW